MLNQDGNFFVPSISKLEAESKDMALQIATVKNMIVVWNLSIPLKIKVFSWRFFSNKLPLKDLLLLRNVPNISSVDCLFCLAHQENLNHLFFECLNSRRIWSSILCWIGVDLKMSFVEFLDLGNIQDKVKNSNS